MIRRVFFLMIFVCFLLPLKGDKIQKKTGHSLMGMPPVNWLDPDLRVDLGDIAGAHFSGNPQIAVAGDAVYIVWHDTRYNSGIGNIEDIYFNRSLNRGATWMASDIRLDTGDIIGAGESFNPQISVSGDHIYVVWEDDRGGTYPDIYFNHSDDRGATWLTPDVRVDTGDTAGANNSMNPRLCSVGSYVYVVWGDQRNGQTDIYFNRSANNGTSWSGPVRIDTGVTAGSSVSGMPEICCSGSNVYVTWMDDRNGDFDIYFNRSVDNGVSWSGPVRLDTGDTAGGSRSDMPEICCSGSYVYVVWYDYRTSPWGIFLNRSANSGASWLASDVRVDVNDAVTPYYSQDPRICCNGANVFVTWEGMNPSARPSQFSSALGSNDVFFNSSSDWGLTWQASDTRLDTGDTPWNGRASDPRICCSGSNIHVAWNDDRDGKLDVYLNHSADGGVSWLGTDIRLDTGDIPGAGTSNSVDIACTASNVFTAWLDDRNGSADIYFNTTQGPPVANAGIDGEGRVGETYSLDGSRSYDPDNDRLTYRWSLTARPAGSSAEIDGSGRVSPDFVPDIPGEYRFRLTVTDPFGDSSNDQVTVTAINPIELTLTSGPGGTVIPAPGIYFYDKGEEVIISAVPDTGFFFSGWSGDVTGTTNPLNIVMDMDKGVHANFVAMVYSPINFSGIRVENRSLSMKEYVARITWQANPENYDITGYRITRVTDSGEITLATPDAATFVFEELGVPGTGTLTYHIYTLRADGFESDPAMVTVN